MRPFLSYLTATLVLTAPMSSFAAEAEKPKDSETTVDKVVEVAKENPGKAAGVAGCAAILIFPPAAIWCAATLIGGATYDGDTQKLVKKVTE